MTRPKASRSGTLLAISLLMISSAAIRVALESGPAFAREAGSEATELPTRADPGREDMHVLLQRLRAREAELRDRESNLTDRLKALEIADRAVERKLTALREAETALRETLATAQVAAEDDLVRLTDVYENMKPKEAAILFEEMDPAFAAGFLGRMQPESAAGVMAGLSPQAAYTISVILAGRNASVPKN
ncbi:MotE family protein [Lutimaribacter marinistellae]|uniref:MotE family protein n=1 Tax=Lutimaribacter marinistellae TaxID=1820329 RepID=A0ABV7TCB5_9RHOB